MTLELQRYTGPGNISPLSSTSIEKGLSLRKQAFFLAIRP